MGATASRAPAASTAAPRTSMPRAMSACRSDCAKNSAGLSTETVSTTGVVPCASVPPMCSCCCPGSRSVVSAAAVPAAPVVASLETLMPLPAGSTTIATESPAAGPGPTVTFTAFSLNCSAPTPAA